MSGPENYQTPFWKSCRSSIACRGYCVAGLAAAVIPAANLPALVRTATGSVGSLLCAVQVWSRWRERIAVEPAERLILAYLFLAVVPIVLLLILASMLGKSCIRNWLRIFSITTLKTGSR